MRVITRFTERKSKGSEAATVGASTTYIDVITFVDVVVIGSGAFGASAAYHLARRGVRVAVLERAALASQTSPRAAGLSSQVRATPALTKLAQRAVAKLAAFTAETGQPLRFTRSGALKIARTEPDAEQLVREVERGAASGVPIELVTVAEARKLLPILGERGIVAITWSPTDCNVEPSELPIGYCRAAEELGAVLLPHTPATGFEIGAHGIEGVRTPGGTIATRTAVDAAGAWARVVAAGLGAALPVVPTRHQLLITEPIAGVGPEFPIARVIDANVYVRHERGGLMLGGYEADPLQPDVLPDDIAALPLDIEVLWRLARKVSEQFPIFQDPAIRVAEHRGGLPTLTMDDRYLVGPLPGVDGAYVMSGCCVGGLSVSPALGEAIAEWIVDGTPALDLSEISPARFAARDVDETELRDRCRHAYATHYRQITTTFAT
jgi:glycine/D-amino acid oxidase-like deaminating enzyme